MWRKKRCGIKTENWCLENYKTIMKKLTQPERGLLTDFLNTIRAYEHESHNLIGHDERETAEFIDIYEKHRNLPTCKI